MKNSILIALMALLPVLASAQLPGSNPDQFQKFICIWNDDPSYNMTISWVSLNALNAGTVYYDTVDHGTDVNAYINSPTGQSLAPTRTQFSKLLTHQFAKLTNLTPGTTYYYVISGLGETSPRFFFETIPADNNTRLSFISGGDSRNPITINPQDIIEVHGRIIANKMVAKLRPHAVFFGGDMTDADTALEWNIWFEDWQLTIAEDGRMTPFVAARGNHEFQIEENSINNLFDTPSTTNYYAFNIAQDLIRAYTLDSEASVVGDQQTWLEQDLAANPCTYWKTAQYHHPIRPHTTGKPNKDDQREAFAKNFEKYGLQFVTESDAHLTKSTYSIKTYDGLNNDGRDDDGDGQDADIPCADNPLCDDGFIRDDVKGVMYVGEGGWGAELRPADKIYSWSRAGGSFFQVKWTFIDKNGIEVRTVVTENVDNVVAKTAADDKFTMPQNIDLWDANGTGEVVTLNNPNIPPSVDLGGDKTVCVGCTTTLDAGEHDSYEWSTGETTRTIEVGQGNYSVTVKNKGQCEATASLNVTESSLPIEWISFKGENKGASNVLTWITATESNNDYFVLESSIDGKDFDFITRIAGAGFSNQKNTYTATDFAPLATKTYYRLQQVDFNGDIAYSAIISVTNQFKTDLSIAQFFPNPTADKTTVHFTSPSHDRIVWAIMDVQGKTVQQQTATASIGKNEILLSLAHLQNGIYFFVIEQGQQKVTQRFMKR